MIETVLGVVTGGFLGYILTQSLKALREWARPDGSKPKYDDNPVRRTVDIFLYDTPGGTGFDADFTPLKTPPTGEQENKENMNE